MIQWHRNFHLQNAVLTEDYLILSNSDGNYREKVKDTKWLRKNAYVNRLKYPLLNEQCSMFMYTGWNDRWHPLSTWRWLIDQNICYIFKKKGAQGYPICLVLASSEIFENISKYQQKIPGEDESASLCIYLTSRPFSTISHLQSFRGHSNKHSINSIFHNPTKPYPTPISMSEEEKVQSIKGFFWTRKYSYIKVDSEKFGEWLIGAVVSSRYFWSLAGRHNPTITQPYKGQPLRCKAYTHTQQTRSLRVLIFCRPISEVPFVLYYIFRYNQINQSNI